MEGISDIKIIGVDAKRPPVLRKAPYIDLFFELSHKVPKDWSADFNSLLSKATFSAKVKPEEGLYIETWVRTPDEVTGQFALVKGKVAECNDDYIAKVEARQNKRADEAGGAVEATGEQGRLNNLVAALDFSD